LEKHRRLKNLSSQAVGLFFSIYTDASYGKRSDRDKVSEDPVMHARQDRMIAIESQETCDLDRISQPSTGPRYPCRLRYLIMILAGEDRIATVW
jgi:hypothetical protein